jgi:hypothetical protein
MRKIILVIASLILLLSSCSVTKSLTKQEAYKSIYEQKPVSILVMPPINRSTAVEAKAYFYTTLNTTIADHGYYVFPPMLTMEFLKRESAYDSELFIEKDLKKFRDYFDTDLALFTIIHKWDKSSFNSTVKVEVEYIMRSTLTSEVVFRRRGLITVDTSVAVNGGGAFGALASLALSAINTATTKYVDVARKCNTYSLEPLPYGKFHNLYKLDKLQKTGKEEFQILLK